jgi:hypothetical protein
MFCGLSGFDWMNDRIHSITKHHIIEVLMKKSSLEQQGKSQQNLWMSEIIIIMNLLQGIHALVVIITLPKGQFSSLKEN